MKIKKNECLFFVGIIFLLLKSWISVSELFRSLQILDNILMFSAYIFFLISIIIKKPRNKEIKIDIILITIGILTYICSKYTAILTLFFVLISMKDIEVKKVVKLILCVNLFLLMIHILLYSVFMIFDNANLKLLVRTNIDKVVMRYSFFFIHPNVFAMYIFWSLAMFYYLYYEKISNLTYIITIGIALFVYFFPNSRTCAIEILLLLITTIISKRKFEYKWLKYTFVIIILFCTISIFFIDNPIIMKIDDMLNTRISIGNIIYKNYGITLFGVDIRSGTPVTFINGRYISSLTIIDSVYYSVLLNYGLVSYIIFIYLLYKAIDITKYEIDNRNKVMLFVYIIYAISETSCLSPILGFPLLLLSNVFKEKLWKKK